MTPDTHSLLAVPLTRNRMAKKPRMGRRIISAISNRSLLLIIAPVLLIALISIAIAYYLTPPDNLVMTTGFEGGAYANFGERYRQILAREKINLKVLSPQVQWKISGVLTISPSGLMPVLYRMERARHQKRRIWFPSGPYAIPLSGFFIEAKRRLTTFPSSKERGLRSDRRGAAYVNLP